MSGKLSGAIIHLKQLETVSKESGNVRSAKKLLVNHTPVIKESSQSQSYLTAQSHAHSLSLIYSPQSSNESQVLLYTGSEFHSDVLNLSLQGFKSFWFVDDWCRKPLGDISFEWKVV